MWRRTLSLTSPDADLLRLQHPELGIADLLVAGTDYQQEALQRARGERLGSGETVWVLAAEDVILHKLIAGRAQDHADIEAILAAGVVLDGGYIDRWAEYWDRFDVWQRLRVSR